MRLLPCGDTGILVELADATRRRRLDAALRQASIPDLVDHVPAAVTVLVRVRRPAALPTVAAALRALETALTDTADGSRTEPRHPVQIAVRYDGPDLDEVANHLGVSPREVVRRHTGQLWTVEFTGFAPGFGYLVADTEGLQVPRRATPRTRIPPGAVGLAGAYTGVYPRASPGGWQLIGQTGEVMWDPDRDPPALFAPGVRVRFVEDTTP